MTTKTPIELSSTPSVVDNGNATAITIDSSERVGILQSSPTSNLHIGASGNDAKRELRIDGTNGSGQTFGFITEADGENGRVSFKVGQSNATPAQKLMIHPDGGICFGSDTAAANALDDYEEGDWQATHGGNNMTGDGKYVKVGGLVFVQGDWTSATGSSSTFRIGGLPFTVNSTLHSAWHVGYETSSNSITGGYMASGQSYFDSVQAGGTGFVNLNAGERIIMFGTYFTTQ